MKRIHKLYYANTTTSFEHKHKAFLRTPEGPFGNIKDLSVGDRHTLLIAEDGTLWGAGANNYGQLGIAATTKYAYKFVKLSADTDWKMVAAGLNRSIALKTNGTVYVAGIGNFSDGYYIYPNCLYNSWQPLYFYLKPNGDGSPEGGTGTYYDTIVTNATKVYAKGETRYVVANHKLYSVRSQRDNTTFVKAVYSWGSFDHWEVIPISNLFIGENTLFALGFDPNYTDETADFISDLNLQIYYKGTLPGYHTYTAALWPLYDRWNLYPINDMSDKADIFVHSYKCKIAISNNIAVLKLPYEQQLLCVGNTTTYKEDGTTSGAVYSDWTAMTWLDHGAWKDVCALPNAMLYLREHLGELWIASSVSFINTIKELNADWTMQRADFSWDGKTYYPTNFFGTCVKLVDNFKLVRGQISSTKIFGLTQKTNLYRLGYNTYNNIITGILGIGKRWDKAISFVSGPMEVAHRLIHKK